MNIIIDSIACPFMVLLNVLVVSAVKSRPEAFRANQISCLLVRLSVTDAVSGLMRQPTFIFATTLKLFVIRWNDFFSFFASFQKSATLVLAVRFFCAAPDVGDLGETSEQIHHALPSHYHKQKHQAGAPDDNLWKIFSEDDLRSRIFETFVVKCLACLPLLGFSNPPKMVLKNHPFFNGFLP